MKNICLLAVAVLMTLSLGCAHIPQGPATTPAALIIDVRTEQEWKEGHLEGAILIPHDRIEQAISGAAPDRKGRIYLYCRSGRRTGLAYDILKKIGYDDLVNLGTMENASKELNLPVVK